MNSEHELNKGEALTSENQKFKLELQADGDLVLSFYGILLWHTKTKSRGDRLVMQNDGKVVLLDTNNQVLFTTPSNGDYLLLQDDGNLVLFSENQESIWSTNTAHRINFIFMIDLILLNY